MQLMTSLWRDEGGYVVSAELVLVGTVAGLGVITGLTAVRESLLEEMSDLSGAFRSLDQSYGYRGIQGCRTAGGLTAWTAGSRFGEGPPLEPLTLPPRSPSAVSAADPDALLDEDPIPPPPTLSEPPLDPAPLAPPLQVPPQCGPLPWPPGPFPPPEPFHGSLGLAPQFPGHLSVPAYPLMKPYSAPPLVAQPRWHWRPRIPPLPHGTSFPFVW